MLSCLHIWKTQKKRMGMKGLYIAMITVAVLSANHIYIPEIVRMPGTPSIRMIALFVKPLNESFSKYDIGFDGPSDTEVEFNGDTLEVIKGYGFNAIMVNNNNNMDRMITIKSKSIGETVKMYPNLNYNTRLKYKFVENSCYVKIEKLVMGDRTKYIAKVNTFADKEDLENLSKYFIAYIRDRSGARVQILTRHLNETENENVVNYYKYLDTYSGNKTDIGSEYYAILNYPAMDADGITVESFGFVLYVSNSDVYGDDITMNRSWYYEI